MCFLLNYVLAMMLQKSLFLGWIKARLEFYKKEIIIKIIKESATSRPCNISFNKI